MSARIALKRANVGRRVLYISPVFAQTEAFWELVCTWANDAIRVGLISKNETKRTLVFNKTGGRIVAKTGSRPNHLRGDYGDFIILDEAAYQLEIVWTKVCAPMLLDNGGDSLFISTGKKRNWFYLLCLNAQENADGRWRFFTFPSTANPFLSREALADLAADMTDEDYREEILGEAVEGEGAVFRLNREDWLPPGTLEAVIAEHAGHRVCAGLDWGRVHDWTALSIGCAQCSKEIYLKRWQQETYPAQRAIIQGIYEQFKKAGTELEILSEENSMGLPNMEALREDGVPCLGLLVTGKEKGQLVAGLRLAFEKRVWRWVFEEWAWRECEGYESKVTNLGNQTFAAPEGMNLFDDGIVARYMMLRQAQGGGFTLGSPGG